MWNVRRHVPATLWVDRHPTEFAVDLTPLDHAADYISSTPLTGQDGGPVVTRIASLPV